MSNQSPPNPTHPGPVDLAPINPEGSPPPFLRVQDLGVRFGDTDVVRNVSFTVSKGQTVALVGESGSGKSVTALSILQLLPYPQAQHPTGTIHIGDTQVVGADNASLQAIRGASVSMIFQEPMTSLNPLHTVGKQIGETLRVHAGLTRAQARMRALELLQLVRLPDPEARLAAYPHQLSGGQRQRVMIAMALANEPQLLIADEPTTALDVTIQQQILELLQSLQSRLGMGLLLITHDLGIVRNMADHVHVMTQGEIVEHGPCERVFAEPQHPYTQRLLKAEPSGTPVPIQPDAPTVMTTKQLGVTYDVGKGWLGRSAQFHAVQPLDLTLRSGQTIGVVGEAGSGKTS